MPPVIRKEENYMWKLWYPNYISNIERHKKICSAGTLYCTNCPNFSTKSQNDLNYHIAKKHRAQNLMSPSSVNFVIKSFLDFTLYVNIETPNMEWKSDQDQEMWMWNT